MSMIVSRIIKIDVVSSFSHTFSLSLSLYIHAYIHSYVYYVYMYDDSQNIMHLTLETCSESN